MIYVKYGSTLYIGVVCKSVTRQCIRPANFDLQHWMQVKKGISVMFGALQLECVLHAKKHREELDDI